LDKPRSDHFHLHAAGFIITHERHQLMALTDSSFTAQDCQERFQKEKDNLDWNEI
jgi:hypothetical protein